MGVTYKLKSEVTDFILARKKEEPGLSCRSLANLAEGRFQIKLSKSSVNAIIKGAGLSLPVGRRQKKRRRSLETPLRPAEKAAPPVTEKPKAGLTEEERNSLGAMKKATEEKLVALEAQKKAIEEAARRQRDEARRRQDEERRMREEAKRKEKDAVERARLEEERKKVDEEETLLKSIREAADEVSGKLEKERLFLQEAQQAMRQAEERVVEKEKELICQRQAFEEERAAFEAARENIQEDSRRLAEEWRRLEMERKSYAERQAQLEELLRKAEEEKKALMSQNQDLSEARQLLSQETLRLEGEKAALEEEKAQVEQLRKQAEEVSKNADTLHKETEEKLRRIEEEVARQQKEISEGLEKKSSQEKEAFEAGRQALAAEQEKLEGQRKAQEAREQELEAVQRELAGQKKELETAFKALANQQQAQESQKRNLEARESVLVGAERSITEASRKLEEEKKNLLAKAQELDKTRREIEESKKKPVYEAAAEEERRKAEEEKRRAEAEKLKADALRQEQEGKTRKEAIEKAEEERRQQEEARKAASLPKPQEPQIVSRVERPQEAECNGAIILRAMDCLAGVSDALAEELKTKLNRSKEDLLAGIEGLIYHGLYEREVTEEGITKLSALVENRISEQEISTYLIELQKVSGLGQSFAEKISSGLAQTRCIRANLLDGTAVYFDGQMHAGWATQHTPHTFSNCKNNAKKYLHKYFVQDIPLVFFMAPGYENLEKEFFNFLWHLDAREENISRFTLYGDKLEEQESFVLEQSKRRLFVFGMFPWQFVASRKINKIGEFKPWSFAALGREFYLAEAQIELSQPSFGRLLSLRGCALKTGPSEKAQLVILSNFPSAAANIEELAAMYLSHWPNMQETFQDLSRKFELFTYTAGSQHFFSLEGLTAIKQAQGELKALFKAYLEALDAYVRWRFLPVTYEDIELWQMKERFYDLPVHLKREKDYTLASFKVPAVYPYIEDLKYLCRRLNEREIQLPDSTRLWLL